MSPDASDALKSPTSRPKSPLWLAGLTFFLVALAVRLIGFEWGLPHVTRWYSYHPDESTRQIVGAVAEVLQGQFNPKFFNYPSLSIYATALIHQILAIFGLTTIAPPAPYPWPAVRDILVAGRIFSALCGAATAPLVFGIARQLGMGKWAILAAILAILAPGHLQHSHFATVDVPATFFVTLCLSLTLRAQNSRDLLGAALVAGLAAGTKYNAGVVVVAPLVRVWLMSDPSIKKRVLTGAAIVAASIIGFFFSTPYALLAPRDFWGDPTTESGFAFEAFVHPKIGSGEIFQNTGNGWWYHFSFNLPFVLTWPLVIAALVGIGLTLKKREFWPILIFVGVFFVSLGFSQVRYMRYLLPLAPILCLLAAFGASRLPLPRIWGAVVASFALVGALNVTWPFTQTDPRDRVIASVVEPKTIVLWHKPWYYSPPSQPQGFNMAVAGVKLAEKPSTAPPYAPFVISELEWRESLRLGRTEIPAVALVANESILPRVRFKTPVLLLLPGREFVPHDYLYSNPEMRIY